MEKYQLPFRGRKDHQLVGVDFRAALFQAHAVLHYGRDWRGPRLPQHVGDCVFRQGKIWTVQSSAFEVSQSLFYTYVWVNIPRYYWLFLYRLSIDSFYWSSICWFSYWSTSRWLTDCLFINMCCSFIDIPLIDWLILWFIHWLIDRFIYFPSIDVLIDWLVDF